jgi:hypothetical protein
MYEVCPHEIEMKNVMAVSCGLERRMTNLKENLLEKSVFEIS